MRLTLLESDRSFLRSAECASLSILAHAGLVWLALGVTAGGRQLPADEREARAFFLLPPDHVWAPLGQLDVIRWDAVGGALDGGTRLTGSGDGLLGRAAGPGTGRPGARNYARGDLPFGPPARLFDTTFTVFEVDETVERYEGSAAPAYPSDLSTERSGSGHGWRVSCSLRIQIALDLEFSPADAGAFIPVFLPLGGRSRKDGRLQPPSASFPRLRPSNRPVEASGTHSVVFWRS